ncbi:MAG: M20 family metallopeptidase [Candidatus Heimdallarchaeota archaeon]|nr:M20 family metallopeptidase [Candidatus Heimdallarchaeota archaeon]
MRTEVENLTQKMVQTDSTIATVEVATIYHDFLAEHGYSAKLDEYEPTKANVEARIGPSNAKKIVISGHMDTVPIGNPDKWTHHPFSGKIEDGVLWGRGSVDMKGGTAALAGVMVELLKHEDDLQHEIILAVTADEEIGLLGAHEFVKQGIMNDVEHLLIAEPTSLGVANMEKGIIFGNVRAHGKQAHASRPDLGHNAIEALARIMPKLHDLLPDTSTPELGKSTLNIGVINGGTVTNVVPEYAEMSVDYRMTPGVNNELVVSRLRKVLEENSNDGVRYELDTDMTLNAPALVSSTTELGDLLAAHTEKFTGNKPKVGGMFYATDAAAFMGESEMSFAIYGPGSTELLHQTNERLNLKELDISREVIRDTVIEIAVKDN